MTDKVCECIANNQETNIAIVRRIYAVIHDVI